MPDDSLARVFPILTPAAASIHGDGYTWASDVSKQGLSLRRSLCLSTDIWLP